MSDYARDVASSPLTLLRAVLQRPPDCPDDRKAGVVVKYATADDRIRMSRLECTRQIIRRQLAERQRQRPA